MTTFTRITNIDISDTIQVCQIIFDNIPVVWIEYDLLKRIIVQFKDESYYIDGNNLTVRQVVNALNYKRPIVSWTQQGEKFDVLDELVVNAPLHTIHVFTNPKNYLDYSEYDDIENF